MMTQANYLIIGQGDIGLGVTNQLVKLGLEVTGLARSQRGNYDLVSKAGYIKANALNLTLEQLSPFTHVAIIVTPDRYEADAYKNTYYAIADHITSLYLKSADLTHSTSPKLQRIVFISSTGVYGQNQGEWIDETIEPTPPKRQGSQYILAAEQVIQSALGKQSVIIRPSGIYGRQRLMRIRKAQEYENKEMLVDAWTNRIMDSDLINIIVKVLTVETAALKPLYIASDYSPVTSFDLTCWLCDKLQLQRPKMMLDKKAMNVMTGKRLHSNIPRQWLQYPDWQAGYSMILPTINEA